MLGMTLAARLAQAGHRVTLLEAAQSTGGLAAACRHGDYTWDRFYHVILMSDLRLRALLEELGLGDRLRWGTTRTGFFVDGRLHSLSNSLDFALFPPLSLIGKARLAWTITYASRIRDGRALEQIPVTDWLRRLSGARVFDRIWLPLLRAKLGENYRLASAAFIWAIIARMHAARRSGLKQERFGFIEGGYAVVLERLQRHLDGLGVATRTRYPVLEVKARDGKVDVAGPEGVQTFDHAVLTVPCGRVADMVPQLRTDEQARLRSVTYQGIACASMLLRRPLAGYYVTNITDDWTPFTGVIEMTALVDPTAFGGNSLVYLPRYLAQDDPFWQLDDATVRERFTTALERMYPGFRREDILTFDVARVREVLAVSTLRYSAEHLPPLATSVPGVYVVNSAQIAQGTLNVNETVALAEAQSRVLIGAFERTRTSIAGAAA
jgi:protoporphyrinogen oxidase